VSLVQKLNRADPVVCAWFYLSGFVNAQNTHHWDTENPHTVQEVPLHDQKVGVWCAVSGQRITEPILFFYDTVNSERYMNNILELFFQILTEEEKQHAYFQQDNTTAHTSQHSMGALHEIFGERIISQGLWPLHSPDLSVCDFYLWGKLMQNVYRNNPCTL
jgi:hypothetical protein